MPIDRRRFLGALAAAPAALAGCAGGGAAARPPPAPRRRAAASSPAAEAVRAFPLPADAEPAAIFRAAAARPGER